MNNKKKRFIKTRFKVVFIKKGNKKFKKRPIYLLLVKIKKTKKNNKKIKLEKIKSFWVIDILYYPINKIVDCFEFSFAISKKVLIFHIDNMRINNKKTTRIITKILSEKKNYFKKLKRQNLREFLNLFRDFDYFESRTFRLLYFIYIIFLFDIALYPRVLGGAIAMVKYLYTKKTIIFLLTVLPTVYIQIKTMDVFINNVLPIWLDRDSFDYKNYEKSTPIQRTYLMLQLFLIFYFLAYFIYLINIILGVFFIRIFPIIFLSLYKINFIIQLILIALLHGVLFRLVVMFVTFCLLFFFKNF